jgi:hypothetical protein
MGNPFRSEGIDNRRESTENRLRMDLQTFVRDSLVQIINGVREAQAKEGELGDRINPKQGGWKIQDVEFDVALTVEKKTGGGLKVVAGVFGGEGGHHREQSEVSRVKFVVPLVLPIAGKEQPGEG